MCRALFLLEKYQDEMARADRRRAQQECLRLRRLMQQGVISADELQAELAVLGVSRNGAKATSSSGTRASTGRPRKASIFIFYIREQQVKKLFELNNGRGTRERRDKTLM